MDEVIFTLRTFKRKDNTFFVKWAQLSKINHAWGVSIDIFDMDSLSGYGTWRAATRNKSSLGIMGRSPASPSTGRRKY